MLSPHTPLGPDRTGSPLAVAAVLAQLLLPSHCCVVRTNQILPWVMYFATVAVTAAVGLVLHSPQARRWAPRIAVMPLLYLVVVHAVVLPGDIADARDFNRGGTQQLGPTHPAVTPIFDAVEEYTRPDDVITFFRARTMTLLTDRRAIQTTDLAPVLDRSDYFAQLRGWTYYQPTVDDGRGRGTGVHDGVVGGPVDPVEGAGAGARVSERA